MQLTQRSRRTLNRWSRLDEDVVALALFQLLPLAAVFLLRRCVSCLNETIKVRIKSSNYCVISQISREIKKFLIKIQLITLVRRGDNCCVNFCDYFMLMIIHMRTSHKQQFKNLANLFLSIHVANFFFHFLPINFSFLFFSSVCAPSMAQFDDQHTFTPSSNVSLARKRSNHF